MKRVKLKIPLVVAGGCVLPAGVECDVERRYADGTLDLIVAGTGTNADGTLLWTYEAEVEVVS